MYEKENQNRQNKKKITKRKKKKKKKKFPYNHAQMGIFSLKKKASVF